MSRSHPRSARPGVLTSALRVVVFAAVAGFAVHPPSGLVPQVRSYDEDVRTAAARPAQPTSIQDTSTDVPRVPANTATLGVSDSGVAPLAPPQGFAAATTGGANGVVYRVTSAADSAADPAPGTLRHALDVARSGTGTWIVFDRDLTIAFEAGMRVPSNTTIDGRGHRVVLTGHGVAGLQVYDATNVILENLTLTDFGDTALTTSNDQNDAIDIQRSTHVWVDHCTLSRAGDKAIAVADGSANLTFSWNRFHDQEQTVQIGAMYSAARDVNGTVTLHHNYFDQVGYRLPLVLYSKAHVYNNYMYAWKVSAVRSERLAQIYLESNVFTVGPSRKATTVETASTCNDNQTLCDGRAGYLADVTNLYIGRATAQSTGTSHVFTPRSAYAYQAEPATTALASRIASGAGARPVAAQTGTLTAPHSGTATLGSTSKSPKLPKTPKPPKPPKTPQASKAGKTRVVASLRARNLRRSEVLVVQTGRRAAAQAQVRIFRRTGGQWSRIADRRLNEQGYVRLEVRDLNRRRVTAYRAVVGSSDDIVGATSNTVHLR